MLGERGAILGSGCWNFRGQGGEVRAASFRRGKRNREEGDDVFRYGLEGRAAMERWR